MTVPWDVKVTWTEHSVIQLLHPSVSLSIFFSFSLALLGICHIAFCRYNLVWLWRITKGQKRISLLCSFIAVMSRGPELSVWVHLSGSADTCGLRTSRVWRKNTMSHLIRVKPHSCRNKRNRHAISDAYWVPRWLSQIIVGKRFDPFTFFTESPKNIYIFFVVLYVSEALYDLSVTLSVYLSVWSTKSHDFWHSLLYGDYHAEEPILMLHLSSL